VKRFLSAFAPFAVLLLAACLFDSPERRAGGGSETEYIQVAGIVTRPDGSPAAGCRVAVRPAEWLYDPEFPRPAAAHDTTTDAGGRFAVKALPAGSYRIEGSLQDSLGFMATIAIDSGKDTVRLAPALAHVGTLSIGLADPDSTLDYYAQAYGMQRHALLRAGGATAVTLPPGEYRIRIIASDKSVPAQEFTEVVIRAGADTVLPSIHLSPAGAPAVNLIFDSNIGFALDDAASLSMLHTLADRGEARILATGTTNPSRPSPAVLDVINTYHGRGNIPVGAWKRQTPVARSGYDSAIAVEFPHDQPDWDSVPAAAEVYRRALEGAPEGSVVMVCTGDVRNAWDLLQSSRSLIARKVKRLVLVGGHYPSGKEFNFAAATGIAGFPNMIREVLAGWPGPVHMAGMETGDDMASGSCLTNPAGIFSDLPLKRIYTMSLPPGSSVAPGTKIIKPSTDLIGVLYAVRGTLGYFDLVTGGGYAVGDDGATVWDSSLPTQQAVLVRKGGPDAYGTVLDSALCVPP